jgi:hypothetical protein
MESLTPATSKQPSSPSFARLLLAVLALLALDTVSLQAEDVIVTSTLDWIGTANSCPPSCCDNLGTTTTSSTYSTATPAGIAPRKTRFGVSSLATWAVTPTLACSASAYKVYVSKGTTGSCPTDILVRIVATSGCTLFDTNGVVVPSGIVTRAFQKDASVNVWTLVAIITNSSATPTITFSWASGGFNRWYMDEVRFGGLDCCCCVPPVGITGPLAAGQTNVNVTSVTAGATNVTVYVNWTTPIGWTNYAPGFAAGTIAVPTLPLVKGDTITATQTRLNAAGQPCTSDQPLSGPVVGGGANPRMMITLDCVQSTSFTGPVGTPTTGSGTPYWLKANGTVNGAFGTPPVGGWEVTPGTCWQTLYYNWATDPCWSWLAGVTLTETNRFAALESLVIGIDNDDPDSGPYNLYLDTIMNGTNIIADFEGFTNNTPNVNFANPNATPIPNPNFFLSAPMSTRIAQDNVFSGTNSCRVQWQFVDNQNIRWCRLLFNQPPLVYPQLDTHQPVTVHLLVLPVGQSTGQKFNGTVSAITNTTPLCKGGTVEMGVTVTGSGSYTYRWYNNGVPTVTTRTCHDSLPFTATAGPYSVTVSDGTCSASPLPVTLNLAVQPVTIGNITGTTLTYGGGNACKFVLLQSSSVDAPLGTWTRVQTNTVLPGSFTITTVGTGDAVFYCIQSE